jgi:t-SNARE complex subunit (syntaxin)
MEALSNPVMLALIGTLFGSAGLKIIEYWLSRAKIKEDTALQMRDELRKEIDRKSKDYLLEVDRLRIELTAAEKQVNEWRDKYYTLIEDFMRVKAEYSIAIEKVKKQSMVAQPSEL